MLDDFTKENTTIIKGVAILLMLIHHGMGFPDWLLACFDNHISFWGVSLNSYIAMSSKMCVGIFAFMTGWGYSYCKNKNYTYSLRKIVELLERYWFVFLVVFIPVSLICSEKSLSVSSVIVNLLALSNDNIVRFAWYVHFYILIMLTLPVLRFILDSKNSLIRIMPILIADILCILIDYYTCYEDGVISIFQEYLYWSPCIFLGYILADSKLFLKMYCWLKEKNAIVKYIIILSVIFLKAIRAGILGLNLDLIYVPILVSSITAVMSNNNIIIVRKILKQFGEKSLTIWFVHGIFFSSYTKSLCQKLVYFSNNVLISYLTLIVSSLLLAVILDYIFKLCICTLSKVKSIISYTQ